MFPEQDRTADNFVLKKKEVSTIKTQLQTILKMQCMSLPCELGMYFMCVYLDIHPL